jgi:hypothetical protein
MTRKTFFLVRAGDPELVTLGAVGNPLQTGVSFGELPWSDHLSTGWMDECEAPGQGQEESGESPPETATARRPTHSRRGSRPSHGR